MSGQRVDFMPEDSAGRWETGRLESEVEERGGLMTSHTADVRTSDGVLHEHVTVVPPKE
jgi:hypothetical protein